MADYTYKELMKMQSDAIRRAEDMQLRARKTAGLEGSVPAVENTVTAQAPKRIQMPQGYLNADGAGERRRQVQPTQQSDFFERIKNGLGDVSIDSDKALLLSLIMLLSEEQADELLIMALIYMLS